MGMEDGSNYFEGGGSGDSGGYGDIGLDEFTYGYGVGGGDFVLDPGFGLPDNVSPDGNAIAWGFDTTSWPTLDQGGGFGGDDFNYGYGVGTEGDLSPIADQALMIDPYTGFIDTGSGYLYDPVADQFYDLAAGQGDEWRGIYDDWRAFGVDPETAAQLADQDYQALRESQGVISISQSATELPNLPDLPEGQYFPLPYTGYDPWQSPPYVPTFQDTTIPPPPPLPPSPASGQPGLPPACAAGTYHPYPIGHPQQNICVPFPAAQTQAPKPPTGTSSQPAPKPAPKPPAQQPCPTGYTRDPATGQCKPIGQSQQCAPGQYYSQRLRRCATPPKCAAGFIFDPVLEGCVRIGTQTNTLPAPSGGGLSDLFANTPPWLWAALLAGLVLLSSGDDNNRVSFQRRRAA